MAGKDKPQGQDDHRQRVREEIDKVSEQQRQTQQRQRQDRTDDSGAEEER